MCSLGENCRRPVCFFAHSEQEMRVTPYSKLDTAAAAAAQQLAQMQRDGTLEVVNQASSTCSSEGDRKLAATSNSSPCGSEIGINLHSHGSPCSSVAAADDGFNGLAAGMALNNQAAMLEMQLQSNALALAAADMGIAADAAAAALTSAPGLWLTGSTSMMQPNIPLTGCSTALNPFALQSQQLQQQQQQMMVLDSAAQLTAYSQTPIVPVTAAPGLGDNWLLPTSLAAAAASNRLAEQYAASRIISQQRQAAFNSLAGLTACNLPSVANPSMYGASGLDQWLQVDNIYGAPPGLNRPALSCNFNQPRQDAGMAQLLSALPDQTVQQLLGMLTIEPQA